MSKASRSVSVGSPQELHAPDSLLDDTRGTAFGGHRAFSHDLDLGLLDTGFATVGADGRVSWVNHAFVEMTKGPAIFWIGRTMPSFMIALAQLGEAETPQGLQNAVRKAMVAADHRWHVWRILVPQRRWVFQRESEFMPDGSALIAFSDVTRSHTGAAYEQITAITAPMSRSWRQGADCRACTAGGGNP